MEACAGAHHRARELQSRGYTVRLIPSQYVKPYVKSNKNDANDAEAICEAKSRPNMRFVAVSGSARFREVYGCSLPNADYLPNNSLLGIKSKI
jgi:transposase